MIAHLVLFKLRADVGAREIDWMLRETRIQLLKIPLVLGLRCGCKINPKAEWSFFILVELDSPEKLSAYMNNLSYLRFFNEVIKPNVTEHLTLEFQTNPGGDPMLD